MQWTDQAVILGARKHGETSLIVEAMTRQHGRHFGMVRGGRSARMRAIVQPGNVVEVIWRARLDEHLGLFSLEAHDFSAGRFLDQAAALFGLVHLAQLTRLLAEREPHPGLYDALLVVLDHLDQPSIAAPLIVRFELQLLAELGFGLDLSACAVTGATQELVYVSPKSGRAVCRQAGEAYAGRLLRLPAFMRGGFFGNSVDEAEVAAGFALTERFLRRDVYEPRGLTMPEERERFIAEVLHKRG